MERLIFHIDVNSAFLSWEAARRVSMGEEDIRLIPSAIGGDRDKRTGVILAKSIPAKKYGVKTGEPVAMALRKCPDLFLARPDFKLYEKNSRAFMDICRRYAPVVEKYSIDECFLDMTGTGLMYKDPLAAAYMIKDKIKEELGFTVNVGIGPNKILAKMAGDFEKPDKVHTLFLQELESKLWPLPVRELFTVGRSTGEKLERAYITTIGHLAKTPVERVQSLVGKKLGQQIWEYANGIDPSPVLSEAEEAKGYSISTTLEQDVTSFEGAAPILLSLSDSVTSRMRAERAKASCISVTIRSSDFKNSSHQCRMNAPTDITAEVYSTAKRLFFELWDGHTPLRLLGISLTELQKEDGDEQLTLFEERNRERERNLDKTVDDIRRRFGADTVVLGGAAKGSKLGKKYRAQIELKNEKE